MSVYKISPLKKRADFLRLGQNKKQRLHLPHFSVQYAEAGEAQTRIGFTVTKKIGNAVERNRIRRRLRGAVVEVLSQSLSQAQEQGQEHEDAVKDYVLVARREALQAPFPDLVKQLKKALRRKSQSPLQK